MSGFGERLSQRQKCFKKGVDADEARRKREDAAVQLRKQTREEALQKKRMTGEDGQVPLAGNFLAGAGGAMQEGVGPTQAHIITLSQSLTSDDRDAVFTTTQQLRKLLSVEQNPPIQEVIGAGVVPFMVQFLRDVSRPNLQFEAAWVLTNIASGTADQTRVVVEHGALPLFVELLQSPNEDVREQAVWALGNIAGDSPNLRDLVLQSGGLNPILAVIAGSEKCSLTRNATWALSNLCRGKPPPPLEWILGGLPTLAQLLGTSDVAVLTDACWAWSYVTDGSNDRIAAAIEAGVAQRLVELLQHASVAVQTPALRAVGNIVTGDDRQTQMAVQCGLLAPLLQLLSHQKKNIRKESCWAVSNITAGNRDQIQAVIAAGLIPPIINHLQTGDFDVKKEAAWVISNATAGGNPQQIEYLVQNGCIKPMVDLLGVSDVKVTTVALESLENILKVGKQQQQENGLSDNPIVALVEQADGLAKIEALQEDPNEELYRKAMELLEKYFPLEAIEDDDDAAAAAASAAGGREFSFGAQVPQGGFNFAVGAS